MATQTHLQHQHPRGKRCLNCNRPNCNTSKCDAEDWERQCPICFEMGHNRYGCPKKKQQKANKKKGLKMLSLFKQYSCNPDTIRAFCFGDSDVTEKIEGFHDWLNTHQPGFLDCESDFGELPDIYPEAEETVSEEAPPSPPSSPKLSEPSCVPLSKRELEHLSVFRCEYCKFEDKSEDVVEDHELCCLKKPKKNKKNKKKAAKMPDWWNDAAWEKEDEAWKVTEWPEPPPVVSMWTVAEVPTRLSIRAELEAQPKTHRLRVSPPAKKTHSQRGLEKP